MLGCTQERAYRPQAAPAAAYLLRAGVCSGPGPWQGSVVRHWHRVGVRPRRRKVPAIGTAKVHLPSIDAVKVHLSGLGTVKPSAP